MRATALVLALVLALVTTAPAGAREAVYLMRGPQLPVQDLANGYAQVVAPHGPDEIEVRVATDPTPIQARAAYSVIRLRPARAVPSGFVLPPALAARLDDRTDAWEAATQVLEWVTRRVALDPNDSLPQDAISVLRRHRGRCSGLANASVALLLAAGFEARTVSGLLMTDRGPVPHRWLECRFPEAGWVPADPTLGLWTITPRHVVFNDAVRTIPEVRVVSYGSDPLTRLPLRSGMRLRPNEGIELVCRVVDPADAPPVVATLHGPEGEVLRTRLAPEGSFSRLLPGRWILVVEMDGALLRRQELHLSGVSRHLLALRLPRGPALEGPRRGEAAPREDDAGNGPVHVVPAGSTGSRHGPKMSDSHRRSAPSRALRTRSPML
jgi:hypothetical protein